MIIIIVLLATTGRANMHPASYVFGNVVNRKRLKTLQVIEAELTKER